jgi:hypothetical protein
MCIYILNILTHQMVEMLLRFELIRFANLFQSNYIEFEFDSKLIRISSIRFNSS